MAAIPYKSWTEEAICFAGNASYGKGGQGEFLRQMVFVLDQLPKSHVFSRYAHAKKAVCHNLPFSKLPQYPLFKVIAKSPLVRRRKDWLVLLSDFEFDQQVATNVEEPSLFDGVMGQCCRSFTKLKRTKTRLVLTCLNTHIDNLAETLEGEQRKLGFSGGRPIHPKMRRRALREIELADRIRVNSSWAKRTFIERGVPEEKVEVIPLPVDGNHFHPVEKKDSIFRVLAVSDINPRKGIHYLLQAFEEAKIPNSELVLIGGTGDRWSHLMLKEFQQRNRNIRNLLLDVVSAPVDQSYGSASLLVHPALEDGYGLVIAQALASGRPVIATRQAGAAELIDHGKNGFVIESRGVKELKEYLRLLASDSRLLQNLSQAAAGSVKQLTYPDFARQVTGFYRDIMKNGDASQ